MEIKKLSIEGYKSIKNLEIFDPNPFTVFVGPNAAGKSNIFESLEFFELCNIMSAFEAPKLYGNIKDIFSSNEHSVKFYVSLGVITPTLEIKHDSEKVTMTKSTFFETYQFNGQNQAEPRDNFERKIKEFINAPEFVQFTNFSRLFVGKKSLVRTNIQDDSKISLDASNLEKILKRILKHDSIREDIVEILQLLIPGFANFEIATEELSGTDNLLVYEEGLTKPLTKRLISDGTYNIIALIAALYQSEQPQFLCIEEPENGLNPKVISELVKLFRNACKEKGHFIWLNTHSQTLVSELTPEEIILVDKVQGETRVKQIQGMDLHGLRMDEALLTNALGGGTPW